MTRRRTRRWWLASLLGLLAIVDGDSPGQSPEKIRWSPVLSSLDPRLATIRRASTSWESRQGPDRAVVDLVCLVPDLPTFLEAVSTWDRGHYFPVLFDDVESSFRFIRAFKPARIVRLPRASGPIRSAAIWDRSVLAVGDSWKSENSAESSRLKGDAGPRALGPTSPGVVFSSPTASMLAGAVALAAGRFQPLIRLDSEKQFADVLGLDEADAFARLIDRKVGERIPDHDDLGDGCDFLTLAGDYPYRYREEKGDQDAVDDRIGRVSGSDRRWAFAGRLLGDATESAYRAMCSLFLQPDSAMMFNTYDEGSLPWSVYATRDAAVRLSGTLPTSQVAGSQASLEGWHETFDPANRFGLVLINSMGGPGMFGIQGRHAIAVDIPRSVPSAVLMIHSFSAADPNDPTTIAARWLANGAFVFFGSMNEPFVDAFRAPRIVADLIAQGLPLVVAVRQLPGESRGMPWRLVFLGDPLFRIKAKPGVRPTPRLDRWEPTARWPAFGRSARPALSADADLFLWSLKTALAGLQVGSTGQTAPPADDLVEALLAIRRGKLTRAHRPVYDALLVDHLIEAKKRSTLKARLSEIPGPDRSSAVRRTSETLEGVDFFLGLSRRDLASASAAWLVLLKGEVPGDFKNQGMILVATLANSPAARDEWRATLSKAQRQRAGTPDEAFITAELKRVDEERKAKP